MNRSTARDAWEEFYRRQPRPWGGAVELPLVPASGRVLELGCGGGRLLIPLLKRVQGAGHRAKGAAGRMQGAGGSGDGERLVGLDLSRNGLLALVKECAGLLVQAEAAYLPIRAGSFDLVLCRHLLEHLLEDGRQRAAAEILRVLKRGGKARFEGFSVADVRFGEGKEVERNTFLRGDGILHHYFDEAEVRRLFAGASSLSARERGWTERAGKVRMRRAVVEVEIRR